MSLIAVWGLRFFFKVESFSVVGNSKGFRCSSAFARMPLEWCLNLLLIPKTIR